MLHMSVIQKSLAQYSDMPALILSDIHFNKIFSLSTTLTNRSKYKRR